MTIAHYCILIAAAMPYLLAGLAKAGGERPYDNSAPRAFLDSLSGWQKRADWAQQNSFEVFPIFAASVLIATQVGAPSARIDQLACAFIVCRVVYAVCYIKNWATARTIVFGMGFLTVLGLFIISM